MKELIKHGIASLIILLFCTLFFIESLKLPSTAASLPQIIIMLITILSILMFIQAFIKYKKSTKITIKEGVIKEKINIKRVLIFLGIIVLYIFTIDTIGYFIVTPIFAFISLLYLTSVRFMSVIFITIGFTVGIYVIFVMFLRIPIPMGLLSI